MLKESLTELSLPYADFGDKPVRVYVPEHEEDEKLPVIYMTDGQNLFDEETATFGCWHTRETVRAERSLTGRAAIIVGIHSYPDRVIRTNELTPKSIGSLNGPPEVISLVTPQAELFDDFIIRTVKPAVESRFPVLTGRDNTAFCGSSCGGVFTYFTALSHPDLYCAAGVLSPAFYEFTPDDLERWTRSQLREEKPFLYVYSGAGDMLEAHICQRTEMALQFLKDCYPEELIKEVIIRKNKHHESAWEPIFQDFLHIFLSKGAEFS